MADLGTAAAAGNAAAPAAGAPVATAGVAGQMVDAAGMGGSAAVAGEAVTANMAGMSGTPPVVDTAGASGSAGATAAAGVAGMASTQGMAGMGGEESGGTDAGGAGGTEAMAGTGGEGGSGPIIVGDDRCDVAVYDPNNPPQVLNLSGSLSTHDPSIIEQDGVFYEFNTGRGLPGKTSQNLTNWSNASAAFSSATTSWVSSEVPAARDLWAPDLSFFNNQYHIYYSASSFGDNNSCIGHATRDSMASGSFTDHGSVICSQGSDNYNAIDPNIFIDIDDRVWLFFGSHWDGIKAIELDPTGMTTMGDLYDIAARPQSPRAIEAAFVVRRCGYYYLFVSFDQCCNNWTQAGGVPYNIRVGRSESLLGPYVDKEGTAMYPDGGGTLLLGPGGQWDALGHSAVIFVEDRAYNIYHAYNPQTLRVAELVWDEDGWPISGGP